RGYRFDIITIMAKLVGDVAPFDITEFAHPAYEFLAERIAMRGSGPDVPDTRRLARLLRARRERPRGRRAAEHGDERAALHSITSLAGARRVASRADFERRDSRNQFTSEHSARSRQARR